jgi:hypothetical protein
MSIYVDSRNNVGDVTAESLTADDITAGTADISSLTASDVQATTVSVGEGGLTIIDGNLTAGNSTLESLDSTAATIATATIQTLSTVAVITNRAVDASEKSRVRMHVAELTTTGNTPTAVLTVPAVASSVMDFEVLVVAVKSTDDAHWKRTAMASFRVSSLAAATELGTTDQGTIKSNGTVTSMAVTVTVSGTNLNVLVTGRTAETWRWGAKVTVTTRTIAA